MSDTTCHQLISTAQQLSPLSGSLQGIQDLEEQVGCSGEHRTLPGHPSAQ